MKSTAFSHHLVETFSSEKRMKATKEVYITACMQIISDYIIFRIRGEKL